MDLAVTKKSVSLAENITFLIFYCLICFWGLKSLADDKSLRHFEIVLLSRDTFQVIKNTTLLDISCDVFM